MAHVDHYECDECQRRTRRITVHTSEMGYGTVEDLHFCGTDCMMDCLADLDEAAKYWYTGQDLRDGA